MKAGLDRDVPQQMIRGEVEVGNCDRLALGRGLTEQAGLFVD